MRDKWDELAERADELSDSMFLLLEKGEKVVAVFLGEPHPKEVVWTGERYVDVGSPEGNELLDSGKKPTFKAVINVFLPSEESIKVFEMSAPTFRAVFKLRQKYGLAKYAFEIEKQTKSKFSILPDEPVSDVLRKKIESAELHDLSQIYPDPEDSDFDSYRKQKARQDTKTMGDVSPIDESSRDELMARLRQLPRAAIDRFLQKFGVERVRDLPSSSKDDAFHALEALERSGVNPFE